MKLNILRLIVAALCCASALMLIANVRAQKSLPTHPELGVSPTTLGIATPAQTPTTAQERTLGQVGKNIKVLNDLPASQEGTVMNFFAASMGRRCDFCHAVVDGKLVFDSDTKPEKETARSMIKMVLAIKPRPQPAPSPAAGQPAPSPTPRPAGPTADQIVAKYVDAIGGAAAIDKIKTVVLKGTVAGFNGAEASHEVDLASPDKFDVVVTTPQGTNERAFDGKVGWQKTPRGVIEIGNPVMDSMKLMFLPYRNVKLRDQFASLRLGGRDRIGDRDVVIVTGRAADNHRERLFFDAETGLLLRRISYLETMIGVIPEQFDFEDYRDVDGVNLPFTIRVSSVEPGLTSTSKFSEIKLNTPVDDSKFKMPAAPAKTTP